MALIKCPECGKKVSDQAPACPHCGNPNIAAPASPQNSEAAPAPALKERRSHNKAILVVSVVLVLCLAAGGVWAVLELPMRITAKKLQQRWVYPYTEKPFIWISFDKEGRLTLGSEVAGINYASSSTPYEILSPTQLGIYASIYEISFGEDNTFTIHPDYYGVETWGNPTPLAD